MASVIYSMAFAESEVLGHCFFLLDVVHCAIRNRAGRLPNSHRPGCGLRDGTLGVGQRVRELAGAALLWGWWTEGDLNPRLLRCERSALPLSYRPN